MNPNYFENTRGTGVLATADAGGKVNAAVYARPHVMEDGTLAFIMRDRLTHHNLTSNPNAAYLFMEEGKGYNGLRLHLKKVREEQDPEKIEPFRRRQYLSDKDEARFLIYFTVEKEFPLIGPGEE